jgi:hypothetical protein
MSTFRLIENYEIPDDTIDCDEVKAARGAELGLSPRSSLRLTRDTVLILPELPITIEYMRWYPPGQNFLFMLMNLEDWQVQTGANTRMLTQSFMTTGRPLLMWRHQYRLE